MMGFLKTFFPGLVKQEEKTVKVKVLKVKFQNLGENGAEAYFTWKPKSGCFIPHYIESNNEPMPWEAD